MIESISSNIFEYKKLTAEEQQKRGILGRLVGVIADCVNPTRNGRKYSLELWEKVFQNKIMQEKIKNRVCFGEACHPADGREEVDPEKVAICLAEIPKKNDKGQLIGVFDVLDTPCGRILKTMLDYGANIGVSSRGSGDVIPDADGNESVDPDSYDCVCWDAVFVPAVEAARPQYVTESLNTKTMKQALQESVNSANDTDRKVMLETLSDMHISIDEGLNMERILNNLAKKVFSVPYNELSGDELQLIDTIGNYVYKNHGILEGRKLLQFLDDYHSEQIPVDESISTQESGLHTEVKENLAVDNNKANLISELQEALKANQDLENKVTALQEKLSVCYTKESNYEEDIQKYQQLLNKSRIFAKRFDNAQKQISALQEQLAHKDSMINHIQTKYSSLKEKAMNDAAKMRTINESYNKVQNDAQEYEVKINKLSEQLKKNNTDNELTIKSLNEQLASAQKDLKLKQSEYSKNIETSNKLVEKYKGVATSAASRYIVLQAKMLGINPNEIKNRLSESYTFDEIDDICNELKNYKVSINKLPFAQSNILSENVQLKARQRKETISLPVNHDDDIDDQLLNLTGVI